MHLISISQTIQKRYVPAPNYSEENLAADENRRLQAEVKKLQAKLALTKEQRDYWRRETSVIEHGEYYGEYKSLMITYLPTSSTAKSKYYNLLYKAKGISEYNKIKNDMIKSGYFTEKGIADAMKKRSK